MEDRLQYLALAAVEADLAAALEDGDEAGVEALRELRVRVIREDS